MQIYSEAEKISELLTHAHRIVILQADNPDADSLGSALALEQILGDMGKEPILYGALDVPTYLRYLEGWDRVNKELPTQFDASIIVDASTITLFEKLQRSGQKGWLASRPCIVLDHHTEVSSLIPFATITINDSERSSTGELIYHLAKQLSWPLHTRAQNNIMTAILGDTQGLTNQLTSAGTYRVMADMTESGVDRSLLEESRREFTKMPPAIFRYKALLIGRTKLVADGRVAIVNIPQVEINQYSPLYNPAPLIQNDMLQTKGVRVSIVFKNYDDVRITAAIRSNNGYGIAAELAEHFGGGGHKFASGFKIIDGRSLEELQSECIGYVTTLLDNLEQEQTHEALQHANA